MGKRVPIVVAIVVVLLGGGYLIDRNRSAQESVLSGVFEAQPSLASSRIGGRVYRILVREGDTVKAGQPMVQLEAKAAEQSTRSQQMIAEQARQQLLETERGPRREEIDQANYAAEEAQAVYDKMLRGSLPEEIASARERLAQAEAQYKKVLAGSRPQEIAAAEAGARMALAKLQQAQRGATTEERAQLRARLDSALAEEDLARRQLDRTKALFDQGAVPRQQFDVAQAAFEQASARRRDVEQAYRRAEIGTPAEELAQARQAYLQALAQLELVRAGSRKEDIESSRQAVLQARENLALAVKGPREEDVRAAKARAQQARSVLEALLRGNRPEDIARAKAAHSGAKSLAKGSELNLDERTVVAPIDGVVDRILVADGDLVAPGTPVVQTSAPSDIWLRVYLPESELSKVHVGDAAELAVDGISGLIAGKVESIATKGEFTPANLQAPEERGKQVFGVRVRLAAPNARVKAGMYATVRRLGQWP